MTIKKLLFIFIITVLDINLAYGSTIYRWTPSLGNSNLGNIKIVAGEIIVPDEIFKQGNYNYDLEQVLSAYDPRYYDNPNIMSYDVDGPVSMPKVAALGLAPEIKFNFEVYVPDWGHDYNPHGSNIDDLITGSGVVDKIKVGFDGINIGLNTVGGGIGGDSLIYLSGGLSMDFNFGDKLTGYFTFNGMFENFGFSVTESDIFMSLHSDSLVTSSNCCEGTTYGFFTDVPEPNIVWLFSIGLFSLGWIYRSSRGSIEPSFIA
ncbi:hypothetical protein [Candidatus Nitrosacidococcus tergens]|uniref:Uncharacterized protein n=1 Tax=Candidatus Nitrosacidococcus tergens TaxID=553981 RepID=A0A7G1QB48_9GAMM|nr:hypothetical protein [Candidatus Nitrosacidococcus tergens]CAB1276456.1 protein of unknown function [Candidatus Nitrosacidococcus tergens]